MTHLNIQQEQNIEVVSTNLIKKLYEAALSVPEPLEGEQDAAHMSGNLQVDKSYRTQVEYLTNRFNDLHINVTNGYYIPFEDSNVLSVLLTNNIGTDGIGVTEAEAANATLTSTMFKNNTDVTSFDEFTYFTTANTNPPTDLFRGCTNLEQVNLSNTIRTSNYEFAFSGITEVNAPLLQQLGNFSFAESKIENIIDLGQVAEIPSNCFNKCPNLVSAIIPETTTQLGQNAFSAYNTYYSNVFTTITGLNNVTSFGEKCFSRQRNLNLNASDIRSAVSIGPEAFDSVSLFSGDLDLKNLQNLGSKAFFNTKISKILSLGKITSIPNHVVSSDNANSNLTEVYIPYECLSIGVNAFYNKTGLTTIKQYADSVDDWIEGQTPLLEPELTVTSIGEKAFYNCYNLAIKLNCANLVSIGIGAFEKSGITEIENLGTVSTLPFWNNSNAFSNCRSLQKVQLPQSIRVLERAAFDHCQNLTQISGLENVTSLGELSFNDVNNISSIMNFKNLTTIGFDALGNTSQSAAGIRKQVYFPKLTTSNSNTYYSGYNAHQGTFQYITVDLIYFRDIQTFHPYDFCYCTCTTLVINNTTPPAWNNQNDRTDVEQQSQNNWQQGWRENVLEYSTIGTIYVPDSAVTTYQQDSNWSTVANKIQPLSQLTKVATEADLQVGQVALIEAYM